MRNILLSTELMMSMFLFALQLKKTHFALITFCSLKEAFHHFKSCYR